MLDVVSDCELPIVGTRNQTQIFCKSSVHSTTKPSLQLPGILTVAYLVSFQCPSPLIYFHHNSQNDIVSI